MDLVFVIFLALFIPGLLTLILIVVIALPRAVRDEKRETGSRCIKCGSEFTGPGGTCPKCEPPP